MHPADIQSSLKKKGYTQKALARHLDKTEMAISRGINERLIADNIMR